MHSDRFNGSRSGDELSCCGAERILLIEDDESLAELFGEFLSQWYEVQYANDGLEAMVQLSEKVDIVLLDRNLGNWTAQTILGVIQDKRLDCKVLIVTGEEPEPEIARFPIENYLQKPVKLHELKECVEEALFRKNIPKTEQELLALVSRQRVLEETHSWAVLEESEEYRQLLKRIRIAEAELGETPEELPRSKFQPSKCSRCGLRWDVKLGSAVGFVVLSSNVWKCARCRNIDSVRNAGNRRVARR